MDILLAADAVMCQFLPTLVTSIRANNKSAVIHLVGAFPIEGVDDFRRIDDIPNPCWRSPNGNSAWTRYSLIRCYAARFLECDKVLWLDADTIVDGSLAPLFRHKVDLCGAVKETANYFNSGVLLMNLAKIREENADEAVIQLLNERRLLYPDQDAINEAWRGRITELDPKWNSCQFTKEVPDRVIKHYASKPKPWNNRDALTWWRYHD